MTDSINKKFWEIVEQLDLDKEWHESWWYRHAGVLTLVLMVGIPIVFWGSVVVVIRSLLT